MDFFIDNVTGLDGTDGHDGTTWAKAWKTLSYASVSDNYDGANKPWDIYIKNNGWDYPYIEDTRDHLIQPNFSGTSDSVRISWYFDFSPIIPGAELTGLSWTLLPGSANVYYCTSATALTHGMYAFSSLAGSDDIMLSDGTSYFARLCEPLTYIPTDWEDHCYYHDSGNSILYWCDKSGNPATSGVRFVARRRLSCFSSYDGTTRIYHSLINPHFYGGADASTAGVCFQTLSTIAGHYINIYRGYLMYGGLSSVISVGGNVNFYYCLLAGSPRTTNFGLCRTADTSVGPLFYNCTIYNGSKSSGTECIHFSNTSGTAKATFKNCLILNTPKFVGVAADGAYTLTENNNMFGITAGGRFSTLDPVIALHGTDQWTDDGTGKSVLDANVINPVECNLGLMSWSAAVDTGVDLGFTTDINGNSVPFRALPDIGAYEARYRNFGINRTINIEIEL